jgi:hypothetical protein
VGIIIELAIINSNIILAWVTYLVVPEEKHPHVVRKVRHHVSRIARVVHPGRSSHVARHRIRV